jgi:molybdate transport system substrate-binding protein
MIRGALIFCLALLLGRPALAGEVTVAVASNFVLTAETIAKSFEAETGHRVVLTHGSTGALYAQIVSGAPFDIFLAADAERPMRLKADGLAREVRAYALGKLVLVSDTEVDPESAGETFLGRRVALADPLTAPYGLAAIQSMEALGLDTATFQSLIVANVGQVAALYSTGNAELAFVSAAQLPRLGPRHVLEMKGRHRPIRQDAAFLVRAEGAPAAEAFWGFLTSDKAASLIAGSGYDLP